MDSDDPTRKSPEPASFPAVDLAALASAPLPALSGGCLEFRPTPLPRARVRWGTCATEMTERWLPVLHGLVPRTGDIVLLLQPANMVDPIVAGVIDRLEDAQAGPGTGPSVQPATASGKPAARAAEQPVALGDLPVEVVRDLDDVILRIGKAEMRVNLDTGRLRISARWLQLASENGDVEITSDHDVVIGGNVIHLN